MTTQSRELSLETGQPVRLYEFSRGPLRWMYCTADRDITVVGKTFKGNSGVSDSGIQFSGQSIADLLTITLPASSEVSLMYRALPPSDPISVVIWDHHYGESDYLVVWVGVIQGVKWPTDNISEITCQSLGAALDMPGLRLGWTRGCPYSLYNNLCTVNKELYKVTGTVIGVSGITVNVGSAGDYPSGWFSGGFLEWDIGEGVKERRGIRQHTGTALLMLGGAYGIEGSMSVVLYPGCVRTLAICNSKFGNDINFGGVPGLPGSSPFDGNPIF